MMAEILKILIVDDEPGMQTGALRALRDFRVQVPDVNGEVTFEVDTAGTGEDALVKIEANPPQLLLLDHKLPGISGLDVLDRTADLRGEMLTIMITAYASLETAVTATKRGAYDFLAKPFTPAELRDVVRKAAARIVIARQARRLAEEKRQVRFQFISVLAHELKAPLAAIEGYLRIVRTRAAGDVQETYDHMLDRSLTRVDGMRKLIFDLLDMTRIESGLKKRELIDVDVLDVAQTAIETLTPDAEKRGITIASHADAPVTIRGDRGEIEIILNNLVSNAVKYNRDGGRVDVAVSENADAVTLTVADTGIGMSDKECSRLFGDFVRIKNEKTKNILGSGLGLSTVKKLAALYGGDATVESRPDVGTTFTITLLRED